jgi:hypothetical protein
MRKSLESSNVVTFPPRASSRALSFPRRTLAPIPGSMTCLVLVKHGETEKALLVSDNGDESKAVWCPKAMLIVEKSDSGIFIVATLPKSVAEQKRLYPRWIDRDAFTVAQLRNLSEAESLAARNRNRLRNYRDPLPYPGRNAFA